MIYDNIKNIGTYERLSPNFKKAIAFLKSLDYQTVKAGDFEIEGRTVYGFTNNVPLKDVNEVRYENHQNYADIQFVLKNSEKILVAQTESLSEETSYNPSSDIAFWNNTDNFVELNITQGDFAIFFPQDAHKPCLKCGSDKESFKMVVKVRLDI